MNTFLKEFLNIQNPYIFSLFLIIFIIDVFLKGYALWMSAQNKQKAWFVCIFIFNTLGLLPLVYILISKNKKN